MRPTLLCVLPLFLVACTSLRTPPRVSLSPPPAFAGETVRRTFQKGEPLTNDAMARRMFPDYRAEQPMTVLYGRWTNPSFTSYPRSGTYYGHAKYRGWTVEVRRGGSPKVLRAFQAKDGYEADLGFELNASARIYPRFRRKQFSWGDAVSFLVQYQNDNTDYVPNNGMLLYEVHGVTRDHGYTIRAQFGLTHPKLTEFGSEVREYRDDTSKPDSAMRRDRDYLLVEQCSDDAFEPSISAIDAMLDTLRLDGAR